MSECNLCGKTWLYPEDPNYDPCSRCGACAYCIDKGSDAEICVECEKEGEKPEPKIEEAS